MDKIAVSRARIMYAIEKRVGAAAGRSGEEVSARFAPMLALNPGMKAQLPKPSAVTMVERVKRMSGHRGETHAQYERSKYRDMVRGIQEHYPKEKISMDTLQDAFLKGVESVLLKVANKPAQAYGFASKLVKMIRKSPIASTATAMAGGAGLAAGAAGVKAKSDDEARQRDRVRQLLISRLSEGGQSA